MDSDKAPVRIRYCGGDEVEKKNIRLKIERVLCLLAQTYEPWTSIQISQENLSTWPVNGDLIDLNEDFHVTLEDEIIEDTTNPQPMITQF